MAWTTIMIVAISAGAALPLEAQRARSVPDLLRESSPPIEELSIASALESALRDSLIALARSQLGRRYRYGAESPERGFDCSGLVRYVLTALELEVPRTAALQASVGAALPSDTAALRLGDLLIIGRGRRVTHIGIYVGDGRFVHASSAAGRVVESPLHRPAHPPIAPWRGARRLTLLPAWPGGVRLAPTDAGQRS